MQRQNNFLEKEKNSLEINPQNPNRKKMVIIGGVLGAVVIIGIAVFATAEKNNKNQGISLPVVEKQNDAIDADTLWMNQFVNEDVFLSINNGASLANVTTILGLAARHQFTVATNGHTWTLIKCFMHTGREESYKFYQLLFRDDILVKTIGWIQMEREEYEYEGTTAARSRPWDIEDLKYVKKAIEAPAVSHSQIRREIKKAQEVMEKYKGNGNIPRIIGYLFEPFFRAKAKEDYPVNEQLRRKFDGRLISLGITTKEVDALYGAPLRTFVTKNNDSARIYGDNRYLGEVTHFLIFPYVAVLFDHEGRAKTVYSNGFFCNDWYPNMPEWRR